MNTVYTETTCDRCSAKDRRTIAEPDLLPVGWASLGLHYRAPMDGWVDGGGNLSADLCPRCAATVKVLLSDGGIWAPFVGAETRPVNVD